MNKALWVKAAGARLLRTARVRADSTVIAANVAYPTDAGLLAKAVGKLVGDAAGAGGGRGRRRAADRRMRELAARLRPGPGWAGRKAPRRSPE